MTDSAKPVDERLHPEAGSPRTTVVVWSKPDGKFMPVRGTPLGDGSASILTGGALVPEAYDEIVLTYTGENVTTAVYKLAGVTVATLTLTYNGSDCLERVVKS